MDPSSVITQVAAPSDGANPISQVTQAPPGGDSIASNNNASTRINNENDATAAASQLAGTTTVSKGSKKRSRRNFLCSIICCMGKGPSKDKRDSNVGLSRTAAGAGADAPDGAGRRSTSGPRPGSPANTTSKDKPLLPELSSDLAGKKCIVIDLDETLVHSSFQPISNADFIVPVEIEGTIHQVYVLKRPHVDEFLFKMGELYECVLFTASLAKYADPVADLLDKRKVFRSRLFRESCVLHRGNYVKDLSKLGRELHKVIIVDNSPASYIFHPNNAVPVSSWFDDTSDRELLDLIPFLDTLSKADSVYGLLKAQFHQPNNGSTAEQQSKSNQSV